MDDTVRDYVQLHLKLKKLSEERKAVKQEFDDKEELIKTYMEDQNIGQLNLLNGSIKLKTSTSKASLKKEFLVEALADKVAPEKAQELTDHILNASKNKTTEKKVIKLTVSDDS